MLNNDKHNINNNQPIIKQRGVDAPKPFRSNCDLVAQAYKPGRALSRLATFAIVSNQHRMYNNK